MNDQITLAISAITFIFCMSIAVLIVTVSHRTFSGQFRHLSGQFFPLSDQINTSSYVRRLMLLKDVRTFSVAYYEHCHSCDYHMHTYVHVQ